MSKSGSWGKCFLGEEREKPAARRRASLHAFPTKEARDAWVDELPAERMELTFEEAREEWGWKEVRLAKEALLLR